MKNKEEKPPSKYLSTVLLPALTKVSKFNILFLISQEQCLDFLISFPVRSLSSSCIALGRSRFVSSLNLCALTKEIL